MDSTGFSGQADSDFDLDVTFIDNGTPIADLMNSTSDGCGSTSASACTTCLVGG